MLAQLGGRFTDYNTRAPHSASARTRDAQPGRLPGGGDAKLLSVSSETACRVGFNRMLGAARARNYDIGVVTAHCGLLEANQSENH